MANIVIPEIPQACKNKIFGASDIKWVKNVNDRSVGNPASSSAYLCPDPRVIKNSDGVFFCLGLNPRFTVSLNQVPIGDIILLYQRLDNQKTKCFTHLVTPIGDKVIPSPYAPPPDWPGRWVKVIAMTRNQALNSIPFTSTIWLNMGFTGAHHNLSYMAGRIYGIANNQQLSGQQLSNLQNDIWNRFQPCIV